jgi:prepilin signal peptidase PulO-like enzyme (type II secretory pathway)
MIIVFLIVFGLCMGSFVNALVWRVHEQANETNKTKPNKKYLKKLSIKQGRSMCLHCKHELTTMDLVPVFSWLSLRGKCRYCKKDISAQYPIVELATALLFMASYYWWPAVLKGPEWLLFGLWLILLTGLLALLVYDLHWQLLPNRIMYPLGYLAVVYALTSVVIAPRPLVALTNVALSVAVGGGVFYVLFQVSEGKWIGGGDVKLGWLLGLIVATPARALLVIFIASVLGTLVSLPLLAAKKLKPNNTIPFGPYLIMAAIIVVLFGHNITLWYQNTFFNFGA